jgi:hypothetical protein
MKLFLTISFLLENQTTFVLILSVRGYLLFFNIINYVDEELKRALAFCAMCRSLRKSMLSDKSDKFAKLTKN